MRSHVLSALLVLGLMVAGCADKAGDAGGAPGGDGEAQPGTLEGVVVDDAIRPVAGVRIDLDNAFNSTTGTDGTFRFDAVAPGAHVVRATKNGYADAVTQVVVAASEPTPLVKLVLLVDASDLAYAEVQKIEGYIECGTDTANRYFAACGTGNVASFILCAQTSVCQGNVTGDSYIVIQRFDRTPSFLVVEVAWTPTQLLGSTFSVWLGSATKEQLQFYPETPSVWNITEGESPLYGTMNSTMLNDSGIGKDSWFLAQMFAGDAGQTGPVALGVVVQQRFEMFLTSFYGYEPPADWRFATTGMPPLPPTESP